MDGTKLARLSVCPSATVRARWTRTTTWTTRNLPTMTMTTTTRTPSSCTTAVATRAGLIDSLGFVARHLCRARRLRLKAEGAEVHPLKCDPCLSEWPEETRRFAGGLQRASPPPPRRPPHRSGHATPPPPQPPPTDAQPHRAASPSPPAPPQPPQPLTTTPQHTLAPVLPKPSLGLCLGARGVLQSEDPRLDLPSHGFTSFRPRHVFQQRPNCSVHHQKQVKKGGG